MDMNNSAVNLGSGGYDIRYMQDGGMPLSSSLKPRLRPENLRGPGPGMISPTPAFTDMYPDDQERLFSEFLKTTRGPDEDMKRAAYDTRYYEGPPPAPMTDAEIEEMKLRGRGDDIRMADEAFEETGSQRSFLNSISGPGRVLLDGIFGGGVNTKGVTKSARPGSDRYDEFYVEGQPDFQSQLIEDFDYPSVADPETGDMIIPTDKDMYSEKERTARARIDMPAYQELEDARGHMLGSALLSQEYGTNTAAAMGGIGEFMDYTIGGSTKGDVAMDTRNNAIGRQIFQKAGIDATAQEITRLVDGAIFKQLKEILGRTEDEQGAVAEDQPRAPANFKSPSKGPDLFYPRDEEGFYDTKRDGYEGYE